MSTLRVDNLNSRTGTTINVPSGTRLYLPGHVIQVQSTTKTDAYSMTSLTFTDIPSLAVAITPTSANSKIFVMARVTGAGYVNQTRSQLRVLRDSTAIGVGDAAGSRERVSMNEFYTVDEAHYLGSVFHHLDSPSTTSTVTYKVQIRCGNNTYGAYVNRSTTDGDASYYPRGSSTITVWEIAQ